MEAAHESSEHAATAESTNVGQTTLDQIRDDVLRLARATVHADPIPLFYELIRVRNRIYALLEGHQYPRQANDLYLLASMTCCVLADVSLTFGQRSAALEQTRAAWAYAEIIGQDSLRVWCRATQSYLAHLDDRPREAVALARSGQRYAHNDISRIRLYSMEGNAHALLGDRDEALRVFDEARGAREQLNTTDEIFDGVGGTFSVSAAKQFQNAANGYVQLGLANQAAREAQTAIDIYTSGSNELRDYELEARSRIHLASAHAMMSQLDAVVDDLAPVFRLPANQRSASLKAALQHTQRILARPSLRNSSESNLLGANIEAFSGTVLPAGMLELRAE